MPEKIERKHLREIIELLLATKNLTKKKAWRLTKDVCKKYGLKSMPTNVQILNACKATEKEKLRPILLTKPMRTSSGITIITVAPKPAACPGQCIYCPKGENSPQSYTGLEPAIQRAKHNDYDPAAQVKDRLKQYNLMGHPTDKIQLIIIGGTFLALEKSYKQNFIQNLFNALNDSKSKILEEAKKTNETATNRCVGLVIETRPDFCTKPHINEMLGYGTTMVEIGVQSIYPEILKTVNRMHTIEDVKQATALAKDACMKVNYHVMPGLPDVDFAADVNQFKEIFLNPEFKPDALKIYPTLVVKGTELYEWWKSGKYEAPTPEQTIKLLAEALKHVPKYCRIVRMQRTVSAEEIVAGVKKSNLREIVEQAAEKSGVKIKEIRYREVGHADGRAGKVDVGYENAKLCRMDYDASGGKEVFLSFEDVKNDVLIGFLRLRIPNNSFRPEINDKTALVRELHVYGPLVPIGGFDEAAFQHRGFGARLLAEAERITKEEFGKEKIVVISGVGVREYYYNRGYKLDGPYVSKMVDG